jgi:hypothetical protein
MANAFNSMSRGVIFLKLRATSGDIIQIISFAHAFYAFESPLFYSHHNCEDNATIIPFPMGTHQGDPLGETLFALAHFRALCSIANHFPLCLFPSIADDNHIMGPPSIISFANEHFHIVLCAIGLSIQPLKCVTRLLSNLP